MPSIDLQELTIYADRGQVAVSVRDAKRLIDLIAERDTEIARLSAELAEAQAVVEKVQMPDFYWDDRDLEMAIEPGEVVAYDDVGDIVELRPIHELPTVWALVTEEGPEFFGTLEAAEAARGEEERG